jgi:hypothetical protein
MVGAESGGSLPHFRPKSQNKYEDGLSGIGRWGGLALVLGKGVE